MKIKIWTDGACSGTPGPGGWGVLIERDGVRREVSGSHPKTTNNIMEMTACIEGLRMTEEGAEVDVWSDSQYVVKGITEWMANWKRKRWTTSEGKPVKNVSLWQTIDILCGKRKVAWHWVRGHDGHVENEICDRLAVEAKQAIM